MFHFYLVGLFSTFKGKAQSAHLSHLSPDAAKIQCVCNNENATMCMLPVTGEAVLAKWRVSMLMKQYVTLFG